MSDQFPYAAQRAAVDQFALALNSSPRALTADECGDPVILGNRGHVYAVPKGWQFFVMGWTARGWTSAKAALNFATICNDGDDEGEFILDRLPSASEAAAIRKWLGVPKRVEYDEATLARKRAAIQTARRLLTPKSPKAPAQLHPAI